MQCYTELIPPTAVTHAVTLPFLSAEADNLVVAKTSLLQIFEIRYIELFRYEIRDPEHRLQLVGEYPLSGTVTALSPIQTQNTKSGGSALLIAFKDAKLSLVEWDPENYRISTTSIHYYEGNNIISQPFGPSLSECETILTVDPGSRCAALKFGARHLAILPFRQAGDELAEEKEEGFDENMTDAAPSSTTLQRTQSRLEADAESDEAKQTPYKPSFVLPLTTLDPSLTHPVDLAFLHEYREPTFGILSGSQQPSMALLEERRDCLTYTVFTLDLEQRASTNLVTVPNLPSDLWKVVPLALPVGGALLVGTNDFVHVDQSGKTNAVAVNEFARKVSAFNMADQSSLNMKLEDCEITTLDVNTGDLLIVLNDGTLAILTFDLLGRNVGGLHVSRVSAEQGEPPSWKELDPRQEDTWTCPYKECKYKVSLASLPESRARGLIDAHDSVHSHHPNDDARVEKEAFFKRYSSRPVSPLKSGPDSKSKLLVVAEEGGLANSAAPSCIARLRNGRQFFVGSEDGTSHLLSWTKVASSLSRKRSHAQMQGAAEDAEDDEVDDDDLYATTADDSAQRTTSVSAPDAADAATSYRFAQLDHLNSIAPINNICFGKNRENPKDECLHAGEQLDMLAAIGRGRGSKVACMSRDIAIERIRGCKFAGAKGVWTVCAKTAHEVQQEKQTLDINDADSLLFVYDGSATNVYKVDIDDGTVVSGQTSKKIEHTQITDTEFESEGETLFVGTLKGGSRVVQVRRTEIRVYEVTMGTGPTYFYLGLSQIIPMVDEETDAELNIVSTSVWDPYVAVLRDDGSLLVLQIDTEGELQEYPDGGIPKTRKWLSACLYARLDEPGESAHNLWALSDEGSLYVFDLNDLKEVYCAPTLMYLPPVLSPDVPQRRGGKETLTEILVASLGTVNAKQPYLVVRTSTDDLVLYEPFFYPAERPSGEYFGTYKWKVLRWRKVPSTYLPKYDEGIDNGEGGHRPAALQACRIGERQVVYIPGEAPSFLLKELESAPKILPLRAKGVKAFTPLHYHGCEDGFALLDGKGWLEECRVPDIARFDTGWSVSCLWHLSGQEVRHIAYHEDRGVYVVATYRNVDFVLPVEEEGRRSEQEDTSLRPQIPQYSLYLIDVTAGVQNRTSVEMPYSEIITSLQVMPLDISENTHELRNMIVVGTSLQRGEDAPAKGAVTVFDIIDVVPDPDRDGSDYKLHMFAREETKGAVTAVTAFPGGLIGTAQGQKIMIRGLKEDGTCLPVAFLDAQCQMSVLKTLGGSGMWMAGDVWKGVWFGGWTEEPYRLTLLGKGSGKGGKRMEVAAAEFLPSEGQLFIVVVDEDMDLHVLQYDPENPKSMAGQRLLHRSTFHVGHFATTMTVLPSQLAPPDQQQPLTNGHTEQEPLSTQPDTKAPSLYHVLATFASGAVGLITPLDETTYRRLGALQNHLTSVLEHAAGLNPRAYRAVESEGAGGRGVIDGNVVRRIGELGSARRAEIVGRSGGDGWVLRSDLEIMGGGGLGYL